LKEEALINEKTKAVDEMIKLKVAPEWLVDTQQYV
jgi:hypothetical protein